MPREREPGGEGKNKEKPPKTKPMPLDAAQDYTEWAKKAHRPTLDDKGEKPPEAPQDLKEPREHGSKEQTAAGAPQ